MSEESADPDIAASGPEHERVLASLVRTSTAIAAELDLQKLIQLLTDEATRLCGAEVGAFFHNHPSSAGEGYMLYTLSGVDRAAFERFPMPRNTEIFEPTFSGRELVRLADVTKDPRYGRNPPYYGMPEGHVRVRSYLAVPVVSPRGAVHGGLFFGHATPDVFRLSHERLIGAVAAQAAVAIDNARLYESAIRERDSQMRRAELAEQLGAAVTSGDPIDRKLERCVQSIVRQLEVDACGIWRYDFEDGALHLAAQAGLPAENEELRLVAMGERDVGFIGASRKLLRCNDLAVSSEPHPGKWAGDERIVSLSGYPLCVHDRLLGVLVMYARQPLPDHVHRVLLHSVDQVALALEADHVERQRESFRDVFIWMLGHDLRNPLNAISIGAQILTMSKELPERCLRIAKNVQTSSQRMGRMVTQLLDFARVRAAGDAAFPIHRTQTDLRSICTHVLRELRESYPEREIRERYDGDMVGSWDADRMAQLFSTLLGNALRHGEPDGPVSLQLRREGDAVVGQVHNLGKPIAPENLPSILNPFRRAGKVKTTGSEGLGLGLYMAHQVVLAHGGDLTVSSSSEEGTTFSVRLPATIHDA